MIVVRINDRGPYGNDRVISLSRAAADRLNTSNNTKVRIDPIIVAQDGSLSGPGMACTTVAKQTYALPSRPDLSGGNTMPSAPDADQPQGDIRPISNSTLKSDDATGAPVNSNGFLGAPTTLAAGCSRQRTHTGSTARNNSACNSVSTGICSGRCYTRCCNQWPLCRSGGCRQRAGPCAAVPKRLSQQFGVPGRVVQNGAVWRIQMGPFTSKAEASTLQQRLQSEAQLQSFITGV